MKAMFRDDVLPRLLAGGPAGRVIRHARINCFGLGESAAEQRLGDVTARGRDPEVGITVHEATITLRIVASAATEDEARAKIAATKAVIYERMGSYAFGEEDDELEDVVVRALRHSGQTVATSEIATGGLLAHRLTGVRGAAECFAGGGIERAGTTAAAAVELATEAAATAMAESCRARSHSDWALAVSDCSHVDGGEDSVVAPIVYVALAGAGGVEAHELNAAGDPAILRSRVAKSALNLLRLRLNR